MRRLPCPRRRRRCGRAGRWTSSPPREVVGDQVLDGDHRTDHQPGGIGDIHPDQHLTGIRPLPVDLPVPVQRPGPRDIDPGQQVGAAVDPHRLVPVAGRTRRSVGRDHLGHRVCLLRRDLGLRTVDGHRDHHQVRAELAHLRAHLRRHGHAHRGQAQHGRSAHRRGDHRHRCPRAPPEHRGQQHPPEHLPVRHRVHHFRWSAVAGSRRRIDRMDWAVATSRTRATRIATSTKTIGRIATPEPKTR